MAGGWSDCVKGLAGLIGELREDGEYLSRSPLDFQNVYPINLTIGQFHQDHPDYSAELWNFRKGRWLPFPKHTVRLIDDDDALKGKWNDVTVHAKWTHQKSKFGKSHCHHYIEK